MAPADDDSGGTRREGWGMNSPAPAFAYISCDIPARVTLREYGRDVAARRSTGDSRLHRVARGLRLGHGALRRPHGRLA
jgi:hypothetical protein